MRRHTRVMPGASEASGGRVPGGPAPAVAGVFGAVARTYVRFRLGCSGLAVERGRQARPPVPYGRRACGCCTAGVVEDAAHVLWECPAYDGVRARHAGLFAGFEQARSLVLGQPGAPLGVASGHFCAFLSQDHRSLARLIFGIVRTRLQGLDPGVTACDGHLDTLSSDEEVDWELFEE